MRTDTGLTETFHTIRTAVTCRVRIFFSLKNSGFGTFLEKPVGLSRKYPLLFRLGGFAAYFLRGFSHKILASK
ncbi:hypothetical protein EAI78_05615 [Bifidobacterium pseudocatenulatum]|nr:hypothetical protein EAI78_05615 [Bifidobacterium pseudocatenulatum]